MKLKFLALLFFVGFISRGQSVIISQYIETNSGTTPKGIEIFNVTNADIVFSAGNNLQVFKGTNGAACTTQITNVTSGTLRAGEVWVLGTANLTAYATTNGTSLSGVTTGTESQFDFNGDDALRVTLGGVVQDMFGLCGSDPGTAWSGGGVSTANQNISILDGICAGDTDGWTDPSLRFSTTSITPVSDMSGFGNPPASCTTPCTTPTNQASDITSSNLTTVGGTVSWTPGVSTAGSIVVIRPTAAAAAVPVSGVSYTANTNYATAAQIDANNRVVYVGAGSTVTGITGLTAGTSYTATVYSYNGGGTNICYNTTSPETHTFTTLATEPTGYPSYLTCGILTTSQITLNFPMPSGVNADGYMILMRQGAYPTGVPTDGVNYTPGATIGNGTVHGYTSLTGTATSYPVTGLNAGTTYYFRLFPVKLVGGNWTTANYLTSATPTGQFCTTQSGPEINVRGIVGSNPTIPDGDTTPQGTDNTLFATVVIPGSQTKSYRIENVGGQPLNITGITLTGANPGDFAVQGITFPQTLAPGTSVDFSIQFTPTANGTRWATVNIANNDPDENPYDFRVQGTGTSTPSVDINIVGGPQSIPNNSLFPSGINLTAFGVATVGVSTVTRTFEIHNLGTTVLNLTGAPVISITGPDAAMFSVTAPPPNSVAGGSFEPFDITFNPTSPGAKKATVTIQSNDPDENPYVFNISGNAKGANNIYVYGNGNDVIKGSTTTSETNFTHFGSVAVPAGVRQRTFLITNLSASDVYFGDVTISGPDAAMFTVVAQTTANATGSGNSTSFTINFTPTTAGVKNATVTFNTYTNPGHTTLETVDPVFTFAISGEGVLYTPCGNGPIQTIAIQDFESTPATPTYGYTHTTNGVVNIAGGTYNNGSGAKNAFIGARSLQMRGIAAAEVRESTVITMDPVDVSGLSNINFSMKVGAFRTGTVQGLDVDDLIQVEVSIDNGVNWTAEAMLRGFSNSRWDFAATGVLNAYYTGSNTGITVDTRDGNAELSNGIATYYVRNLPAVSNLLVRITITVDRDDEIWAIDNIKIEGQTPLAALWNGSSWTPSAPTASTKAIFNGPYNTATNGNVEACGCEINAPVTVGTNSYMRIQDVIENHSTLTVESDASLVQVNNAAVNLGNDITVRRQTSMYEKFDYTYWGSPVSNVTFGGAGMPFQNWRLDYAFEYNTENFLDVITAETGVGPADGFDDDENDWSPVSASSAIVPGKGYAIMAPTTGTFPTQTTVTFNGPANNGVYTVPLMLSPSADATDDYNLLANPYPSALDANAFISANLPNISGTLYLWTHLNPISDQAPGPDQQNFISDDYATYSLAGGVPANGSTVTPRQHMPVGQGFFVESQTGTGSAVFNNQMRSIVTPPNVNASPFFRAPDEKLLGSPMEFERIRLVMSSESGLSSQQLIAFSPMTTVDYDQAFDGAVFPGSYPINFYSLIENLPYKIQARPEFSIYDEVRLGFNAKVAGDYSISIVETEGLSFDNAPVYLEDKTLGVVHDLTQSAYAFTASVGTVDNRFALRFAETSLATPEFDAATDIRVATNPEGVAVRSEVSEIVSIEIFDVLGRKVSGVSGVAESVVQVPLALSNQALIVRIFLKDGSVHTRKVLH